MKQISEQTCRLCLRSDKNLLSIFDEYSYYSRVSLEKLISELTSIKVTENDGLPSKICRTCKQKLEYFNDFRIQIIETETLLRQCMSVALDKASSQMKADFNDDDLQLVCVEEDGTQVFTLDRQVDDIEDSVIVLPINKNKKQCNSDEHIEDISVVVYPKTSTDSSNKAVPLKLLNIFNDSTEETDVLSNYKSQEESKNDTEKISTIKKPVTVSKRPQTLENYIVSCQLCLQQFTKYDELQKHIAEHFEGFNHYENLIEDLSDGEVESDANICKYCLIRFEDNLEQHINSEHSDQSYVCKHCSKYFTDENLFKNHLKVTHFVLQCNLCPVKFETYLQLQNHLSSTHYRGSFWCPPCSKAFTQKYDFILHQRRHLGIKPFQCKFCKKCFVSGTLCKEHERRHTKDVSFLCKYCGKSYVRITDLKNHEKIVHTTSEPITCKTCNKLFSNISSYKLHAKRHELGLRFACNICNRAYYSNSELQRHEQIHSGTRKYPCTICENSFMSQPELNRHLKYHNGEKKYQCNQCGKSYYESGHLRIHERSHTGIKPFECTVCSKRFVSRPKLFRHTKTHDNKTQKQSMQNKSKTETENLVDNQTLLEINNYQIINAGDNYHTTDNCEDNTANYQIEADNCENNCDNYQMIDVNCQDNQNNSDNYQLDTDNCENNADNYQIVTDNCENNTDNYQILNTVESITTVNSNNKSNTDQSNKISSIMAVSNYKIEIGNCQENCDEMTDYHMENVMNSTNNVFGIRMADGNIVLMENGEALINNDLVYTSIEDNVKIEIIES